MPTLPTIKPFILKWTKRWKNLPQNQIGSISGWRIKGGTQKRQGGPSTDPSQRKTSGDSRSKADSAIFNLTCREKTKRRWQCTCCFACADKRWQRNCYTWWINTNMQHSKNKLKVGPCDTFGLRNLIKSPTCFETPSGSFIDPVWIMNANWFQSCFKGFDENVFQRWCCLDALNDVVYKVWCLSNLY